MLERGAMTREDFPKSENLGTSSIKQDGDLKSATKPMEDNDTPVSIIM